ncbi:glycosyltransferase [Cytobacillus oceanisediminis]|uniref:glycosyltransferase n=1 Tax=Cytobacillus oceanisediminis TaxID=665099 RepID=UPI001FB1E8E0|nr:glycosyltransferase [Cytobacillus oceanisediminis]UOE55141.1 glycosyltransferase [Cytobacillus oceanisediminis]
MKVLIIPSWYPIKENPILGIFFKEQAKAIQKSGCDVTVIYPEIKTMRFYNANWKKGIKAEDEEGIKTYRYRGYNPFPARIPYATGYIYYLRLKTLYSQMVKAEGKPDIIHAHSCLWGGWAAAKIAAEEKIPLVVTEHSSKLVRGLLKPYEEKEITKTLRQTDRIISVGPSLKKALAHYTDKEIVEIPNIVDFKSFQNADLVEASKTNNFRFFSLALLTPNKGMDLLIRSFASGFKDQEAELFIGGDGAQKEELMNLAKTLGVDKQVIFLGAINREEVIQQMNACDTFVLASKFETFGVVLIEALACGKPVISTDSGGPGSIVNEKNGIIVPVDNEEKLRQAMEKVYHNYSDYDSKEIREDCSARFSEEVIMEQILRIYQTLV